MRVRRAKSNFIVQGGALGGFSKYLDHYQDDAFALPEGTQVIRANAFRGSSAAVFILPEGLTTIETRAFLSCRFLKMVYIPASVEVIGTEAFLGCEDLTIYCEDEPKEGWLDGEPFEREEEITTPDDYAYDFHHGGVSTTRVTVKIYNNYNPDKRPVVCHCSREDFEKRVAELTRS